MACQTWCYIFLLFNCMLSLAQTLTKCPTNPTLITSNSVQFQICPNSDIQSPSINIINNVPSNIACLQQCAGTKGCKDAVYDRTNYICHIKGSPSNVPWVSSQQYDAILYVQTQQPLTDGTPITAGCPSQETVSSNPDGSQTHICPMSDFQCPSINIIGSVANVTACASICVQTNGCVKAVYDHISSVCHIKGNPGSVPWVVNVNQYDTVYITKGSTTTVSAVTSKSTTASNQASATTTSSAVTSKSTTVSNQASTTTTLGSPKPSNGSPITSCPTQENDFTNPDGSQTHICPMSDFQCPSINIIGSVANVTACASICVQTNGCVKAVYDHISSVCHIKGNPGSVPWVVNVNQYDTVYITRGSTTAIGPTASSQAPTTTPTSSQTPISSSAPVSGLANCPANSTTFTTDDGSLYEICPQTDYSGPTTEIVGNILSDWDCLQVCNIRPTCSRVAFNSVTFTCYVKGDGVTWVSSSQLDSIRLISRTPFSGSAYSGLGRWSAPIVMPVIPVAAYVVPQQPISNRVLMFSSWGPDDFSGATGITQFADFNWQSNAVSARTITNTGHDMFCPGISSMTDGRIVITGGENAEVTSFYDPSTDTFVRGPDMNIPRGYQSSATTSDGSVFTVGGSFSGGIGGKNGEILDPKGQQWTLLPGANVSQILTTDAEGAWRTDNHAWLYGWKDGSIFQAGPSKQQHWFSTQGSGSVVAAAVRDANNDAMCGVNVMFDALAGKILSTGGSQSYTNSDAFVITHITTIDQPMAGSQVERVADMANARGFANGVVLPDGTVLVTGGQIRSLVFTDINSVLTPELFDPTTKTWKTLAPSKIPRNYHSVALLLADGTVFTGGGGMCPTAYGASDAWCARANDHPDAEIFTPPYLLNQDGSAATRPIISSLSSSTSTTGLDVIVGGSLTVTMSNTSSVTFSLIRIGSATHSINTDQRRIPLTSVVQNQASYTLSLPGDSGILIPGYYYLFAISTQGVPSIARTVQIHL